MIGEDGPGRVEAWIRCDSFDDGGEVSDGVQLGFSVVVLGDEFKADLRLLVSKVDRDCLGQVEEWVGVRDTVAPTVNTMSRTSITRVFLSPRPMKRYSQLWSAKSRAPASSWPRAFARGWLALLIA